MKSPLFETASGAAQTNTPDPQLRQRLLAVIEKHADAMNKNAAAAAAALFTEDAVYLTDRGPINGREAIEKMLQTQQRDLLGVAKAQDEFGELHRALDEAYKKNDAAAVAALFTKDALLLEPHGVFS